VPAPLRCAVPSDTMSLPRQLPTGTGPSCSPTLKDRPDSSSSWGTPTGRSGTPPCHRVGGGDRGMWSRRRRRRRWRVPGLSHRPWQPCPGSRMSNGLWPPSRGPLMSRSGCGIGVHTGEGRLGASGYVGIDVHRAARIAASGHGGQVLMSRPQPGSPNTNFRSHLPRRSRDSLAQMSCSRTGSGRNCRGTGGHGRPWANTSTTSG